MIYFIRSARDSSAGQGCKVELGDNVVAFNHNEKISSGSSVRLGDTLVQRCSDVGKFKFSGSVRRKCVGPEFDGQPGECEGLNQHYDYSKSKPPTILFRYEGSISQTNDGRLMVFPGTTLHMECLFMKMYGTPSWTSPNTTTRSHLQGWAQEPMRDATLEYRISIYHARASDSGVYSCVTPTNMSHSVEIIVSDVRCPDLTPSPGVIMDNNNTQVSIIMTSSVSSIMTSMIM